MAALGLALLGGMIAFTWSPLAARAFDASLKIQGGSATFSSSEIYAKDAAFGTAVVTAPSAPNGLPVLRAGFASASMNGFCLTKTESFPVIGSLTLKLTSGDDNPTVETDIDNGNREIRSNVAAFDITYLNASKGGIYLDGVTQIGLATPDLTTYSQAWTANHAATPNGAPYQANPFGADLGNTASSGDWYDSGTGTRLNGQGYTGIDATAASLKKVYGNIWQAQLEGAISLPRLNIQIDRSANVTTCAADAAAGVFPW